MELVKRLLFVVCLATAVNAAGKELYQVLSNYPTITLYKIDPVTALTKQIGKPINNYFLFSGPNCLDSNTRTFWVVAAAASSQEEYNSIENLYQKKDTSQIFAQFSAYVMGISLDNGTIVNKMEINFEPYAMDVDELNGYLYLTGNAVKDPNFLTMFRLNPKRNTSKVILRFRGYDNGDLASAFDTKYKVEWLTVASNTSQNAAMSLVGVDVVGGKIVHQINNDPYNIYTLDYDYETDSLFAIGHDFFGNGSSPAVLASMKTLTGAWNLVSVIDGPWVGFSNIGAIDVVDRIYYALLAADAFSPFQLLGLDMNTGNILTEPLLCGLETCPDGLQYVNPQHS